MRNFGCITPLFSTTDCPVCKRRVDFAFGEYWFVGGVLMHGYCVTSDDTKHQNMLAAIDQHVSARSLHELWVEIAVGAMPTAETTALATIPKTSEVSVLIPHSSGSQIYSPASPDARAMCEFCHETIMPGEKVEYIRGLPRHDFHFRPNDAYADSYWPS